MKLTDIKTYFINPLGKYKDRYDYMKNFLLSLGFFEVRHYKSRIDPNHTKELKRVTIEILKDNLNDDPVLILEDDIKLYNRCGGCSLKMNNIDIPEDCDAYYLGYYDWGVYDYRYKDKRYCKYQCIIVPGKDYFRITNMMGGHAIIYVSKRFKERIIADFGKDDPKPNDVLLAESLKDFNVYGAHCPLFYQSIDFNNGNHNIEKATKFSLE